MLRSQKFLTAAGIACFFIALFQAVISTSVQWSGYFGAGRFFVEKPWLLYSSGAFFTLVFIVFGLYGLSGAGRIRRLPVLKTALVIISGIFILRGLQIVLEILINTGVVQSEITIPFRGFVASAAALVIGIYFLMGTIGSWRNLSIKKSTDA